MTLSNTKKLCDSSVTHVRLKVLLFSSSYHHHDLAAPACELPRYQAIPSYDLQSIDLSIRLRALATNDQSELESRSLIRIEIYVLCLPFSFSTFASERAPNTTRWIKRSKDLFLDISITVSRLGDDRISIAFQQ